MNKDSRKKISTTVYLTPEQDEKLKLLSKKTRVPVSVYIRDGIDMVLKTESEESSTTSDSQHPDIL